jgi:hypothetical protein
MGRCAVSRTLEARYRALLHGADEARPYTEEPRLERRLAAPRLGERSVDHFDHVICSSRRFGNHARRFGDAVRALIFVGPVATLPANHEGRQPRPFDECRPYPAEEPPEQLDGVRSRGAPSLGRPLQACIPELHPRPYSSSCRSSRRVAPASLELSRMTHTHNACARLGERQITTSLGAAARRQGPERVAGRGAPTTDYGRAGRVDAAVC